MDGINNGRLPFFLEISYQEDEDEKEQKLLDVCGDNKGAWIDGECRFDPDKPGASEDYDDHKAEIMGKEQDDNLSSKQICNNLDGEWKNGDCDFPNSIKEIMTELNLKIQYAMMIN